MSISLSNIEDLKLNSEDEKFVNLIENRITGYGTIPYSIPRKLTIDIIESSARYFFQWYFKAANSILYHIKSEDLKKSGETMYKELGIEQPESTVGFVCKLSKRVQAIKGIYITNESFLPLGSGGENDEHISSMESLINLTTLHQYGSQNNTMLGINNNLWITEATCKMVEFNNFKSILKEGIPFSYNRLNNILILKSNIGKKNIVIDTESAVNIEDLYGESLFERYVIAKVKRELYRITGGHTIELPGGVTLNPDIICNGMEDDEKVEEAIKASSGTGDLILM